VKDILGEAEGTSVSKSSSAPVGFVFCDDVFSTHPFSSSSLHYLHQ
jgi:hypothetical protein